MRITYTETFPKRAPADAEAAWRLIRRIVDQRLAAEILKQLAKESPSNIA